MANLHTPRGLSGNPPAFYFLLSIFFSLRGSSTALYFPLLYLLTLANRSPLTPYVCM